MNQSPILTYIFPFLIILISTIFTINSLALYQALRIPESTAEEELAKSLHLQILTNNLDEFIRILNNHPPEYVNIAHYYPEYQDYLTTLQFAATLGRDEFIDELLKRNADPFSQTPEKENTVLHLSPIPRVIKRFIDLELRIEAPNSQLMTPLLAHLHRRRELNREVIYILLEAGANPNVQTSPFKLTPLHIVLTRYHQRKNREEALLILKDLLAHRARVDIRDSNGAIPLHFAASRNNVEAIKRLLDKAEQMGINIVNIRDVKLGNTPLFGAYINRAEEAIVELLRRGANPLLINNSSISVNGEAHEKTKKGSPFNQFVLDAIDKYFRPSDKCIQKLLEDRRPQLMYQIKSLFFLTIATFILTTMIFYSFAWPQVARKAESAQEKKIASLLHTQIFENNLDEFIETLDTYPQHIDIAHYHSKLEDYITLLQSAAILGRDLFIDELLRRGADPFLQTPEKGNTILHLVRITRIIRKFTALNRNLLKTRNNRTMTPLLAHLNHTHPPRATIHALLEAGANPNAQTEESRISALHILFNSRHLRSDQEELMLILGDLLDRGASLTIRDSNGAMPLHFAARNNYAQGIKKLAKKARQLGINYINRKDYKHSTSLFEAYVFQSRQAFTELLKQGANPLLQQGRYQVSVNGKAHRESREGSPFAQFALDEIDKYLQPNTCAPALNRRNENSSYVSN